MKKILFSAMVLAAAVGCAQKNNVVDPLPEGQVEIRLGSAVEGAVASKAAISGDIAVKGLQFLRLEADGSSGILPADFTGAKLVSGDRAVGGAITFGTPQVYDETLNAYFASYFPSGAMANNVITWTIDGKTDVLTAPVVDAGTKASQVPANLTYRHELAQIEVICKASTVGNAIQNRWGQIQSIRVANTPTTMGYDMATLKASAGGTLGHLTMCNPGYVEDFAAIAVPANTSKDVNAVAMIVPTNTQTFALEVISEKLGTKTVTIDLGAGKKIERAKRHVITLTFNPQTSGTPIVVTASAIEAWSDGATGMGNLE